MTDVNEARARLQRLADIMSGGRMVSSIAASDDIRALLDDHAHREALAADLGQFRSLARWVANCAGHGINSGMRAKGERLLALIDGLANVAAAPEPEA